MSEIYEFIENKLYYQIAEIRNEDTQDIHYFSTEKTLVYKPFKNDFGPLNIAQTHAFIQLVNNKMKHHNKKLVYFSSSKPQSHANALTLISLYCIIEQKMEPQNVLRIVQNVRPVPVPFRDINDGPCPYGMTLEDVIFAVAKAIKENVHNLESFSIEHHDELLSPENGIISEMVYRRIYACPSPVDPQHVFFIQQPLRPEYFIRTFEQERVGAIVRLNDSYYDKATFTNSNIHHYDLPYPDGSTPPDDVVLRFFSIMDDENCVALHCMAGLGRTGTLVCLYLMKYKKFTAREAIAWVRLARPGSVSGPQQQYIVLMEDKISGGKVGLIEMPKKKSVYQPLSSSRAAPTYQNIQIEDISAGGDLRQITRGTVKKPKGKPKNQSSVAYLPQLGRKQDNE